MDLGTASAMRTHNRDDGPQLVDAPFYIDPLDPDAASDIPVIVTRRRLIRLALVAAEVGARFQRDAVDYDSMAWMLAPRDLFHGRDAIDATMEHAHCTRAIILHGLGLGLDAHPDDIDALMRQRDEPRRFQRVDVPRRPTHPRGRSASRKRTVVAN